MEEYTIPTVGLLINEDKVKYTYKLIVSLTDDNGTTTELAESGSIGSNTRSNVFGEVTAYWEEAILDVAGVGSLHIRFNDNITIKNRRLLQSHNPASPELLETIKARGQARVAELMGQFPAREAPTPKQPLAKYPIPAGLPQTPPFEDPKFTIREQANLKEYTPKMEEALAEIAKITGVGPWRFVCDYHAVHAAVDQRFKDKLGDVLYGDYLRKIAYRLPDVLQDAAVKSTFLLAVPTRTIYYRVGKSTPDREPISSIEGGVYVVEQDPKDFWNSSGLTDDLGLWLTDPAGLPRKSSLLVQPVLDAPPTTPVASVTASAAQTRTLPAKPAATTPAPLARPVASPKAAPPTGAAPAPGAAKPAPASAKPVATPAPAVKPAPAAAKPVAAAGAAPAGKPVPATAKPVAAPVPAAKPAPATAKPVAAPAPATSPAPGKAPAASPRPTSPRPVAAPASAPVAAAAVPPPKPAVANPIPAGLPSGAPFEDPRLPVTAQTNLFQYDPKRVDALAAIATLTGVGPWTFACDYKAVWNAVDARHRDKLGDVLFGDYLRNLADKLTDLFKKYPTAKEQFAKAVPSRTIFYRVGDNSVSGLLSSFEAGVHVLTQGPRNFWNTDQLGSDILNALEGKQLPPPKSAPVAAAADPPPALPNPIPPGLPTQPPHQDSRFPPPAQKNLLDYEPKMVQALADIAKLTEVGPWSFACDYNAVYEAVDARHKAKLGDVLYGCYLRELSNELESIFKKHPTAKAALVKAVLTRTIYFRIGADDGSGPVSKIEGGVYVLQQQARNFWNSSDLARDLAKIL